MMFGMRAECVCNVCFPHTGGSWKDQRPFFISFSLDNHSAVVYLVSNDRGLGTSH